MPYTETMLQRAVARVKAEHPGLGRDFPRYSTEFTPWDEMSLEQKVSKAAVHIGPLNTPYDYRILTQAYLDLCQKDGLQLVTDAEFILQTAGTATATVALVKRGAYRRGHAQDILAAAWQAGLGVAFSVEACMPRWMAESFYAEHKGRPYFEGLIDSVSGDTPVMAALLVGKDAILTWRNLMGATNPLEAAEGTMRKLYGVGLPDNATHGSDSRESALREAFLFRKPWLK